MKLTFQKIKRDFIYLFKIIYRFLNIESNNILNIKIKNCIVYDILIL